MLVVLAHIYIYTSFLCPRPRNRSRPRPSVYAYYGHDVEVVRVLFCWIGRELVGCWTLVARMCGGQAAGRGREEMIW